MVAMVRMEEVRRHNAANDCWVVLGDSVWDLSTFHASHPGGAQVITQVAGMDGTLPFV